MTRERSMSAGPSRSLMMSFTQSANFDEAEAVGLGNVLRAAESQRKAQLRRLQHLKLSAEKEAEQLRQAEVRQAAERRKQEAIELEKRYQRESLAIHRAETEARRQQILYNSAMNEDSKRRNAEKKVQMVDRRAEKIKHQKEEEAWLRKKHAEDKEMYRQEVLLRNAILEAQKRENAMAKEADLEAQLQQRAAEEAREQRARDHQRALEDDRRQSVMRRVEEEEEMRRYRHAQQLADKEVAVLRKQAEIEENTHARQQQLRLRDEERRAKVAYAQHMEAVAAERSNKRVQEKMDRAKQMEAEREQVLAAMGRLRQEMSMQEDMYRETLHNMKVHNKYNSRNLVDFSASMTDVSLYLSPGRSGSNSGRWSSASSAGGSGSRPRSAPFRKTRPRSASGTGTPGTGTPRSRPVASTHFSPSTSVSQSVSAGGAPRRGSNSKQRPGSAKASPGGRKARESKRYSSISRSALEEPSWDGYSERNDKTSVGGMTHVEVYQRQSAPPARKLTARQQQLKAMIEREQAKEHGRQATLKVVSDPAERERLVGLFAAEREEAKSAILALSCA